MRFQLSFLKKCDFVLDAVTVCVNEPLKTGFLPDGAWNVQMLDQYIKKWTLLTKTSEYITTFIKSLSKSDIRVSVKLFFEPFFNKILSGFRKARITQYALFLDYSLHGRIR